MGEVRSLAVCDKSEQSAALRGDVAGPCESHCFPHGAGNHRGLTLCSCQLLIVQAGEQQKTYSLLAVLPSLPVSSVCSKEPRLPSRHLCSPVPGPSRGQHIRLTLAWALALARPQVSPGHTEAALGPPPPPVWPSRDICCVAETPNTSLTHPRVLRASFVYQVGQNNAAMEKFNPQLSLEIVINRSFLVSTSA